MVVHHRSPRTLGATVESLRASGIAASSIVVVDNCGSDPEILHSLVGAEVNIVLTPNLGYAAAVNRGVDYFKHATHHRYLLVSTHETLVDAECVAELHQHMSTHPEAAVCGPLLTIDESSTVWSAGGVLTPFLKLPRHVGHRNPMALDRPLDARSVEWLDGALLLYRKEVVEGHPIPEDYFLYMEEVDHHLQLRRLGFEVMCVPSAVADQSSSGIPPYFLGRNMQKLQRRHGSALSRALATPHEIARLATVDMKLGRPPRRSLTASKGLLDAVLGRHRFPGKSVTVANPVAATLAHFSEELQATIERAGIPTRRLDLNEPSQASYGRVAWLLRYYVKLLRTRLSQGGLVIVCWPPLGLFDVALTRLLCGRGSAVIVHDPEPLVRAVGHGRLSAFLARRAKGTTVICHSRQAQEVLAKIGIASILLPHPITKPKSADQASARNTLLVFGQYKQDRDLDLMKFLASSDLASTHRFVVRGRRWPPVTGWEVEDTFVSESEVDDLLLSASVVLIPYRKFFQSGVAVRCLELGVPFVGPDETSLMDLTGSDSQLLAGSRADWLRAVRFAHAQGRIGADERADRYRREADRAWRAFIDES
ncbi:glycosyltransferase [Williamsia deligens]|uniref:Glycosyltransferase n=1 Tax=Williamsia deligens TaxID=321325 RepID=A0ABW3G2I2_9NOCA